MSEQQSSSEQSVSNPNTLCARAECRRPYSEHPRDGCSGFEYSFEQDIQDWYEGCHGGGIGQDSARRMMWGD